MDWIRAHRTPLHMVSVAFFAVVVVLELRNQDWIGAALFAGMGALQASFLVTALREDRDR